MSENLDYLENLSHVYKGLIIRNRAFASFREKGELNTIYANITNHITQDDIIFDPMSGYGGGMSFFGRKGFKTTNIELNPPSYYWQVLINPTNTEVINKAITKLIEEETKLPKFTEKFSLEDDLFTEAAIKHIKDLFKYIESVVFIREYAIALLLPFVSRFANYQKSQTNITHIKQGGLCTYVGWESDFISYLIDIRKRLNNNFAEYSEVRHQNIQEDILKVSFPHKYRYFVTSPPYPNYRDYSKLFKIENWVLDNIINSENTDFSLMIGSNSVSGKPYGEIYSEKANTFLKALTEKSKKLSKKSKRDVETYYLPYFSQYFYNIQEAYIKIDSFLEKGAIGYIVVNDNITRDIIVPVGASICDIFDNLGYETSFFDKSFVSHYGNIGRSAKRINSQHMRHILKVWKK